MMAQVRRPYWAIAVLGVAVMIFFIRNGCANGTQDQQGNLYYSDKGKLVVMSLRTGKVHELLALREQVGAKTVVRSQYDISRDNSLLAYVETHVEKRRQVGLHKQQYLKVTSLLTHKLVYKQTLSEEVVFPVSFSTNGRMLALICGSSKANGTPMLRVVDLSDGRTILSSIPAYNNSATWSLDGAQIGVTDVWARPVIVRLSNKQREVLPAHGSPRWSPNGEFIAVDEMLWLVRERRMAKLKLPAKAVVRGWSPDSRSLLYTQQDILKRYPLYIYQVDSGKISKLVSDHGGSDTDAPIWRK